MPAGATPAGATNVRHRTVDAGFALSLREPRVARFRAAGWASLFVGIPLAGLTYWLLSRKLDLTRERAIIAAEASLLDNDDRDEIALDEQPAPLAT